MIGLCVVQRNNKWVITSSDTVTFEEKFYPALKEWQEKMAKNYYKDSEILEYLNLAQEDIAKKL